MRTWGPHTVVWGRWPGSTKWVAAPCSPLLVRDATCIMAQADNRLAALDDSEKYQRQARKAVPADDLPVCIGLSRGVHPVGRVPRHTWPISGARWPVAVPGRLMRAGAADAVVTPIIGDAAARICGVACSPNPRDGCVGRRYLLQFPRKAQGLQHPALALARCCSTRPMFAQVAVGRTPQKRDSRPPGTAAQAGEEDDYFPTCQATNYAQGRWRNNGGKIAEVSKRNETEMSSRSVSRK